MLITVMGGLGSGKTLFTVIMSYYSTSPIVSNFIINFPNRIVKPFDLATFIQAKYENCTIILDEAYTYLESRVSTSELNRIMSYILFQSRKKNVLLYITVQLLSSLDKRYRELSDIFIIANRNGINFSYILMYARNTYHINLQYEKVLEFFKYYNTNEVIMSTNNKLLFNIQDSDDKIQDIESYTSEIIEFYNNQNVMLVSKGLVDLYIETHNNIPKFLSKSIHANIMLKRKQSKSSKKSSKSKKGKKKNGNRS